MIKKIQVALLMLTACSAIAQEYDFDRLDTDLAMAEMADKNPGFGGFYTDSEGRAVLLIAEGGNEKNLVTDFAPKDGKTEVITQQVKYDFAELYTYKKSLRDIMSEPGVVYVDLDEKKNKVVVAVDQNKSNRSNLIAEGKAATKAVADLYGIPEDAIELMETEPVSNFANLRSRLRPAPGGMQVIRSAGGECTMGLVVQVGTINGFITNSHCTNVQGGVENTPFYQPTISSSNLIGREVRDPNYVTGGGCPAGRRCRGSDSALVQFTGNNMGLGQWGYMARPPCSNCNNINISTVRPRFDMVYNNRSFSVGDTVQKVGRTTGWTKGPVTNTCMDVNVGGTNITLLCQAAATLGATFGDSGSLVMRGSLKYRRKMTGLMWGGNPSTTFFSSRDQVEADIGVVDYWP